MGNCLCKHRGKVLGKTGVSAKKKGKVPKVISIKRSALAFENAPIGKGAMGEVTIATWNKKKKSTQVAVKMFPRDKAAEKEFLAEKQVHQQLHHEHIIQLIGYVQSEQTHWLVMEVGGVPLRRYKQLRTSSDRPISIEEIVSVLTQVADAMSYMYQRGIVHNDLHDGNMLITEKGPFLSVKVIDFDTSKEYKDDENTRAWESRNNDVVNFHQLVTSLLASIPDEQRAAQVPGGDILQELTALAALCDVPENGERPLYEVIFGRMMDMHARLLRRPYALCETVGQCLASLSSKGDINVLMTGIMPAVENVRSTFVFGATQQEPYGETASIGNVKLIMSYVEKALDGVIGANCKGLIYLTTSDALDSSLQTIVQNNCLSNAPVLVLMRKKAGYEPRSIDTKYRTAIGAKRKVNIRAYDSETEDIGDGLLWMLHQLMKQKM